MTSPFTTPSQAMTSESKSHFTVAEANRTLPLVSRIVRDIVEKHHRQRRLKAQTHEDGDEECTDLEGTLKSIEAEIERHREELNHIGCDLADSSLGVVDFRSIHDGEVILLCWKLDEPEVSWWHSPTGGFEGRRPIAELPAASRGDA